MKTLAKSLLEPKRLLETIENTCIQKTLESAEELNESFSQTRLILDND